MVAKLNTQHWCVFVHIYTFLNSFTELLCPWLYMFYSHCRLCLYWRCVSTSRCASVTESVCVCRFVRLIEKRHCFKRAEKRGNICHVVQRLHAAGRRVIVCLCACVFVWLWTVNLRWLHLSKVLASLHVRFHPYVSSALIFSPPRVFLSSPFCAHFLWWGLAGSIGVLAFWF